MLYEIATLTIRFGTAGKVNEGISRYVAAPGAKGTLYGCWHTDIGALNKVIILRGFENFDDLMSERERAFGTTDPFGYGEGISDLTFDTYRPFPFLPPIQPGKYGSTYEIRTYRLKHGGVPPTISAWEKTMPGRSEFSPLSIAMYAIDGAPRFTHIWPYQGLDNRASLRRETVEKGVWPPKGGPDWLTGDMQSMIGLPTPFSPLA